MMRKSVSSVLLAILVTAVCASCGPKSVVAATPSSRPAAAPAAAPAQASAATPALSTSIRWVQSSAEYMGIAVQTYRLAATAVETAARGRAPGTWAAVLDADDTVIQLVYQAGLEIDGVRHAGRYRVRAHTSTTVPGAAKFLARVHGLGRPHRHRDEQTVSNVTTPRRCCANCRWPSTP
jgi:predicted secreted acid phosphatase